MSKWQRACWRASKYPTVCVGRMVRPLPKVRGTQKAGYLLRTAESCPPPPPLEIEGLVGPLLSATHFSSHFSLNLHANY
ncbi:hypothetical protein BX666DRAFT_1917219 [Dichotomocladium elegans]|nr:hypothetical protein BX666DRAFT_1917219 [Dichotomocladium elegans]